MTDKTYAANARDTLGTLQDISAKLDRLIDLIAINRSTVEQSVGSNGPRRRRLSS